MLNRDERSTSIRGPDSKAWSKRMPLCQGTLQSPSFCLPPSHNGTYKVEAAVHRSQLRAALGQGTHASGFAVLRTHAHSPQSLCHTFHTPRLALSPQPCIHSMLHTLQLGSKDNASQKVSVGLGRSMQSVRICMGLSYWLPVM